MRAGYDSGAQRVISLVPDANVADPVLPAFTLIPLGDKVTRSPLRPVAVTVPPPPVRAEDL
jgi:hypothetical protein